MGPKSRTRQWPPFGNGLSGPTGAPSVTWCHTLSLLVTKALAPVSQVHLHVGPEVLVDVSLQMDGQVRDAKNGPLHMHQLLLQPA